VPSVHPEIWERLSSGFVLLAQTPSTLSLPRIFSPLWDTRTLLRSCSFRAGVFLSPLSNKSIMAYTDKSLIREKEVRLRLSEREYNMLRSMVEYTGEQMAPLLRGLLLAQAQLVMTGDADIAGLLRSVEAHEHGRTGHAQGT
jgi:hypothetical protein